MLKLLVSFAVPMHYKSQYRETPIPNTSAFYRSAFSQTCVSSSTPHSDPPCGGARETARHGGCGHATGSTLDSGPAPPSLPPAERLGRAAASLPPELRTGQFPAVLVCLLAPSYCEG